MLEADYMKNLCVYKKLKIIFLMGIFFENDFLDLFFDKKSF